MIGFYSCRLSEKYRNTDLIRCLYTEPEHRKTKTELVCTHFMNGGKYAPHYTFKL